MSQVQLEQAPRPDSVVGRVLMSLGDGAVIAKRNVIKIKRVPEVMVFVLMSPIMFVLLFAYVFGGSIQIPGMEDNYREYLIGGIFAQSVVFGATFSGAAIAEDMEKGIINRFKSLPMSRSALLVGRTASDAIYNVLTLVIMALTGLLVGWRINGSITEALVGFVLLLGFGYAVSWIMAWVGLLVPSVEVINNASFMVIMPLTFISNAFVAPATFPGPLRTFAEWNPVSSVTQAARELFGNVPVGMPPELDPMTDASWAMHNPVLYTLIWIVIIIAVFAPLCVRQYRRVAAS